jgi:hypothetical protein
MNKERERKRERERKKEKKPVMHKCKASINSKQIIGGRKGPCLGEKMEIQGEKYVACLIMLARAG